MKKLLIVAASIILFACGGQEVSWDTQEEARGIARENSEANAKAFRQNTPDYHGWNMHLRGDSTIGKNCASGDGWASVDLKDTETGQVKKLKCHTVSREIGCMTKDDFVTKVYAAEEGRCNANLPVPLPRINQ